MFDWSDAKLTPFDSAPRDYDRMDLGHLAWHAGTVTCTATCWRRNDSEAVTFVFPFVRLAQVVTNESDSLGLIPHVAPLRRILWEVSRSPILKSWGEHEDLVELDAERNPRILRHFAIISGDSTAHVIGPDAPVVVNEDLA